MLPENFFGQKNRGKKSPCPENRSAAEEPELARLPKMGSILSILVLLAVVTVVASVMNTNYMNRTLQSSSIMMMLLIIEEWGMLKI